MVCLEIKGKAETTDNLLVVWMPRAGQDLEEECRADDQGPRGSPCSFQGLQVSNHPFPRCHWEMRIAMGRWLSSRYSSWNHQGHCCVDLGSTWEVRALLCLRCWGFLSKLCLGAVWMFFRKWLFQTPASCPPPASILQCGFPPFDQTSHLRWRCALSLGVCDLLVSLPSLSSCHTLHEFLPHLLCFSQASSTASFLLLCADADIAGNSRNPGQGRFLQEAFPALN